MATINLLPWREERREEQKKEFLAVTVAFALAAAAVIVLWYTFLNSALSGQNARNDYLQSRINELDQQVKEISELKAQKNQLVERMEVIQSLQGNRPEIVHIFDELARTLPDGVFYNSIERSGKSMTLMGTAESSNRVSSLMRQLDQSDWFAQPNLQVVKANRAFGEQANDFTMSVSLTSPNKVEDTGKSTSRKK
jgi:type IV pilus assembly protein PilN